MKWEKQSAFQISDSHTVEKKWKSDKMWTGGTRSHDVSGDLGQNNGGGGLQPEEQKELCIVHSSSPIQTKPNQPIKTKPDLVLSKDTKSNIKQN